LYLEKDDAAEDKDAEVDTLPRQDGSHGHQLAEKKRGREGDSRERERERERERGREGERPEFQRHRRARSNQKKKEEARSREAKACLKQHKKGKRVNRRKAVKRLTWQDMLMKTNSVARKVPQPQVLACRGKSERRRTRRWEERRRKRERERERERERRTTM
jgi:hypothetical protein